MASGENDERQWYQHLGAVLYGLVENLPQEISYDRELRVAKAGPSLFTKKRYCDFALELDFKMGAKAKANSDRWIRCLASLIRNDPGLMIHKLSVGKVGRMGHLVGELLRYEIKTTLSNFTGNQQTRLRHHRRIHDQLCGGAAADPRCR